MSAAAESDDHSLLNREGLTAEQSAESAEDRVVAALLGEQPLDPAQAEAQAWSERAGAVVVFSGIVRNHDAGQPVYTLNYTAHPSAEQRLKEVALGLAAEHESIRVWVGHRVGGLEIGDHALVAAVASGHRQEAFAACADLVEQIKAEVPIWKEQFFADGTREWVGL